MPVKKVGKVWEVDGEEYKTEAAAENAYKAKIALSFGIEEEKPKKKTKPGKTEDDSDDEGSEEDDGQ
jgi:hypothetical protein